MSAPIEILVSSTTMDAPPWVTALREALAAQRVAAHVRAWQGAPIGARYAVVWLPPPELFRAERALHAIFNVGAGVEGLLANPALPRDVPLLRLVDAGMAPKMAEYVCFYLARITRGLDRFGGPQPVHDWNVDRPRGTPPTVGVMGLGAIGAQIAHAITVFGYPVAGWSRTDRQIDGVRCYAGASELPAFLAHANVLVDVLPLTRETENLLDARLFAQLPRGAHLINIGRGGTIVDADLISALDGGQLGSAVLDVFRVEPLPPEHPFWHHPRVTVTPHLSGPTPREPAAAQIAQAIAALERGADARTLPGFVERARGY